MSEHTRTCVRREVAGGLDVLDAVAAEPVEDLHEEQRDEEDDELDVELLAEDGHREARLHDRVLCALVQALDLRLPQAPEEDGLEEVPEAQRQGEREVAENDDGEFRAGEVEHRGEVLLARAHRVVHQAPGDDERADDVPRERHRDDPSVEEALTAREAPGEARKIPKRRGAKHARDPGRARQTFKPRSTLRPAPAPESRRRVRGEGTQTRGDPSAKPPSAERATRCPRPPAEETLFVQKHVASPITDRRARAERPGLPRHVSSRDAKPQGKRWKQLTALDSHELVDDIKCPRSWTTFKSRRRWLCARR